MRARLAIVPPSVGESAGHVKRARVVLDPWADDDLLMGRLLCRIGVHRWVHKRNPEGGAQYLECERCHKQKDTISLGPGLTGSA